MVSVFQRYKFLPRDGWMDYTPEISKSVCGRVKSVAVLGGRRFNKKM